MVVWSNSYGVGNAEIDRQHAHIITLVNAVETAASSGEGSDSIDLVITHLVRYVLKHFEAEERLMESVGYPELDAHRHEHAGCARKLTSILQGVEENRLPLPRVIQLLGDWLHTHLLDSDQKYGIWLQQRPDAVEKWAQTIDPELQGTVCAG